MAKYVLELGLEEIPARFMEKFLFDLKASFSKGLDDNRINFETFKTVGTYRRLIVEVDGISEYQLDLDEEVKGPPLKIAFGEKGEALPPAIGFAKKVGIKPEALVQKEGACFAKKFEKGKASSEILPQVVESCISQWSLPIAMRWGEEDIPFFRPLHWIVSLLDSEVIPVRMWGIDATNKSYGHRMLTDSSDSKTVISGKEIEISSANSLIDQLRENYVEPDSKKRQEIIETGIKGEPVDKDLLTELIYLVEWPTILEGTFDKSYLSIPEMALIDCMQKHQKYIPRWTENNTLSSSFWVVAESVTEGNRNQIIKGNERVLKARLEDVKFFWEEDTNRKMRSLLPKLDAIVFQKNLGSVADKTKRIASIARQLNEKLELKGDVEVIEDAALLSKVDLVTAMVTEMPALQGVMGRLYLEKEGEKSDVAKTAEQHYWPKFVGDKVPEIPVANLISIADKIDTVVACFVNKLNPTGSQDPWGVRRAVLGILQIIKAKGYAIDVQELVEVAYKELGESDESKSTCLQFIAQRFEQDLVDQGVQKETARAFSSTLLKDFKGAVLWGKVVDGERQSEGFKALVETAVRVSRLANKIDTVVPVQESLFDKEVEHQSFKIFNASVNALESLREPSLAPIYGLVPTLTTYFEDVLVMAEDEKIKTNRLSFLSKCADLFNSILDWDQISAT